MKAPRIGFAGLGRMGMPIALRILDAGHAVTVWNRTRAKAEQLVERGATLAESPRVLAESSDIVLTSLADLGAVEQVYLGHDGLLAGMQVPGIFIDLSTVTPGLSRRLAAAASERGAQFLDAPVAGSIKAAAEGTLAVMVGGERTAYEECQSLFSTFSRVTYYLGPSGSGSAMKLISNAILATLMQALAEGVALGQKAGLDSHTVLEVIGASSAAAPLVKAKAEAIAGQSYQPAAFTLRLMQKDLWLALSLAHELTVPMPATSVTHDMVLAANATGKRDLDFSAVALLMEELAGVKEQNPGSAFPRS